FLAPKNPAGKPILCLLKVRGSSGKNVLPFYCLLTIHEHLL
ncbi:MAG: hypothetical protein ACI8XU_001226, partial [Kiritimatiellia bacterium]